MQQAFIPAHEYLSVVYRYALNTSWQCSAQILFLGRPLVSFPSRMQLYEMSGESFSV